METHSLQSLVHHVGSGNPALEAVILQIVMSRQIGVEAGNLHHCPGAGPHPAQLSRRSGTEKLNLSGGYGSLGRHHTDDGRLSSAVPAHQAVNLPLFQCDIHSVHRRMLAISLGQPAGG